MFPLNNLSEFQLILMKLCLYAAVMKTYLGIAFGVGRIKVKVDVTKNRKNVSTQ